VPLKKIPRCATQFFGSIRVKILAYLWAKFSGGADERFKKGAIFTC